MRNKKNIFWAGILFGLGILVFLVMFFALTNFSSRYHGYPIYVKFKFVSGLNVGAPVRLSGMEVGEVRELTLKDEYVIAELWMRTVAKVPKDAIITVNTLGLIGERYVEIVVSKYKPPFMKAGETIRGSDPVITSQIYSMGIDLANKLKSSVNKINKLVSDTGTKVSLNKGITQISEFVDNLNSFLSKAGQGLDASTGDVGVTLRNLRLLSEELNRKMPKLLDELSVSAENLNSVSATFRDTFPAVMNNLKTTSEQLNAALLKINSNDGSVGKFLNNPELYDNLNEFSREIKKQPSLLLRKR